MRTARPIGQSEDLVLARLSRSCSGLISCNSPLRCDDQIEIRDVEDGGVVAIGVADLDDHKVVTRARRPSMRCTPGAMPDYDSVRAR